MPGRSGMETLKALDPEHYPAPIFIISGQGDIPMAVGAVKAGAFDFIEKAVRRRNGRCTRARRHRGGQAPYERRRTSGEHPDLQLLTPREREVLGQITAGASNKEAGRTLGHLTAHNRGAPRAHHGKARCQERCRSGAHRLVRTRSDGRPLALALAGGADRIKSESLTGHFPLSARRYALVLIPVTAICPIIRRLRRACGVAACEHPPLKALDFDGLYSRRRQRGLRCAMPVCRAIGA
jgi:FixJ family two-component response regulator